MSPSRALFISAALLSLSLVRLDAQIFQAQITGTVTDASGAVVPGAQIGAVNIATGSTFATKTNEAGIYRFPALPPGQYKVTCAMTGFQRFEESPVTVEVDQILQLDVSLHPGESTQQITVSASAATLDTESATLSQVVTTRSIASLPLNVRDPFALMGLTPGVIFGPNFGNGGGQDVGRNYFKADVYIGGGRSGSNEILIDGAPDTLPDASKAVIDPPVDSVQEFAVQASSYNSQFGRTSGGVVNMVTKSGTNDFHGVVYDFERHSVLDANNFFNNRAGIPSRSFQRHQFGADGGGPVIKGKWFFFGDYEGLRQGYPLTSIDTVPTALQRTGNFSQTFATNGALVQIFDPQTLVVLPDGARQRSPFPGNIIPQNRIDPTAAAVVQVYPLANQPGTATGQNNFIYGSNSTTNSDKYDLRTDGNFSENNRAFFRFSREEDKRASPGNMPLPIGGGRFTTDHYTQAVTDFTHVFSASTVADVNVSFLRALAAQFGASQGFNLASLNLPASFISQVAAQFPVYTMSDVTGTSNGSDSFTQFQPRNVYSLLGSVSHQHGKHSLKFGGAFMALRFNEGQNPTASGTYTIDRTFTQGPNPVQASSTAGFGFASFLLGTPTNGSIQEIQPISNYGLYDALYVHDDWKVSSRLTLNIGLRWDTTMGDREKYNRLAYFNPNVPSPLGPQAGLPNLMGLLSWVGKGNPKDQSATDWTDFAPRFGFAYSLDKKTVIRGGYGMFYMPHMVLGNGGGALEAVRTTPMVASLDGVTPANLISNPFPQEFCPPPTIAIRKPMWGPASLRRSTTFTTAMLRPGAWRFSASCRGE